jgi:uncharacterized protein
MRQIFFLILLFVVGQWLVKALRRAQSRLGQQSDQQNGQGGWRAPNGAGTANNRGHRAALPEVMVRCAECGVHTPQSDSVAMGSQSFCSPEHARAYAARHAGQDRAAR